MANLAYSRPVSNISTTHPPNAWSGPLGVDERVGVTLPAGNPPYTFLWDEFANATGGLAGDDIIQYGPNHGPFHNYSELCDKLFALNASFPGLVDLVKMGTSYYNRTIWAARITDESQGGVKDQVLLVAQHHAREQISQENALYFIDYLVAQAVQAAPDILAVLAHQVVTVVPCVNVDGMSVVHLNPYQRKTLVPYDEDGDGIGDEFADGKPIFEESDMDGDGYIYMISEEEVSGVAIRVETEGVDLDGDGLVGEDIPGGADPNRNYPYDFGNRYFSSTLPASQMYCGPAPLSENCSRSLHDFIVDHNFTTVVSLHSGTYRVYTPALSQYAKQEGDSELYRGVTGEIERLTGVFAEEMNVAGGMLEPWAYVSVPSVKLALNFEVFGNDSAYTVEDPDHFGRVKSWGIWDMFNPPADRVISNCQLWALALLYVFQFSLSLQNLDGRGKTVSTFPLLPLSFASFIGLLWILGEAKTLKGHFQ